MPLPRTLVEDLQAGTWQIDCLDMTLTQNTKEKPQRYSGPGYLRQDLDGGIQYHIYPTSWENTEPTAHFLTGGTPGKLVEHNRYFNLKTVTLDGKNWSVERTLPQVGGTWINDGFRPIVGGECYQLESTHVSEIPNPGYLIAMYFFCDVQLPCNSSTMTTSTPGAGGKQVSRTLDSVQYPTDFGIFRATRREGQLDVLMHSENPFPENFDSRIVESLGLVLAKPLRWNIIVEVANGIESIHVRGRKLATKSTFHRPVGRSPNFDEDGSVWILFGLYLKLVSQHVGANFHPVSRHLFAVLQASVGGPTATALTLGVAVEGIVKILFPEAGSPMKGMVDVVPKIHAFLESWPDLPQGELGLSLNKRLPGLIAQLTNVSTKDKLYALVGCRIIDEELPKAWDKLRNKAAHGITPGSDNAQKLIDLNNQVTVLMYLLIFKGVGYEGPYEDYSTQAWPTKYYRGRAVAQEEIAYVAYHFFLRDSQRGTISKRPL